MDSASAACVDQAIRLTLDEFPEGGALFLFLLHRNMMSPSWLV